MIESPRDGPRWSTTSRTGKVAASPFSTSEEAAEAWRKEEERREAAAKREFRIDIDVVAGEVKVEEE